MPRSGQAKPGGRLPRIDWSHPLANGLLLYAYDTGGNAGPAAFVGATSLTTIDLVTGTPYYLSGALNPTSITATLYGSGFQYDTTNHSSNTGAPLAPIRTATAAGNYTFGCAFIKTGTVGSYASIFGRTANNNASAPFVNWDFEVNPAGAGQIFITANCNSLGSIASVTNATISDNTFTTAVGTLVGGAGTSRLSLYLQGAFASQSGAGNLTPASVNVGDNLMVSGVSSASQVNLFNGVVFYGAFWNRVLSPSEIQMLHLEPYSFLLFDLDELPAVPWLTGAAGGTTQARAMVLA